MKTRIVHTKIWKDEWHANLSKDSKLLWQYLLTNEKINISGVYEITDREIVFDTSIALEDIALLKKELEPKAIFYKGWVKIANVDRYNQYKNSPKTEVAYQKELSYIPQDVLSFFSIPNDTSMHTSIDTPYNHKSLIINKKSETSNDAQPKKTLAEMKAEIGKPMTGISTAWQDEAFRHAEYLGIDLKANPELKSRWLGFYKRSYGQSVYGRVSQALSFLKDYSPFLRITTAEGRMRYFFDVVQNYEKYHSERR